MMLAPVPLPGRHGHQRHEAERDWQRGSGGERLSKYLPEAVVPDRSVDQAQMEEVDEQRFLRDGAEPVREVRNPSTQVRDHGQDDEHGAGAEHELEWDALPDGE